MKITILTFAFFFLSPILPQPDLVVSPVVHDIKNPQMQDSQRVAFEPARRILTAARVPFEPTDLLSPKWREKIKPALAQMPEMDTSLRVADQSEGLIAADTVVLPPTLSFSGDTVILARTIIFEGHENKIIGRGKNIYVFNIDTDYHIVKSFDETMRLRGVDPSTMPAVGSRTANRFEFRDRRDGIVVVIADGRGREDWLKTPAGKWRQANPLAPCLPGQTNCDGGPGSTGTTGDPAPPVSGPPSGPNDAFNGTCRNEVTVNGIRGFDGFPGDTPADNTSVAGVGGRGEDGGMIHFSIPEGSDDVFVFSSRGGTGGTGGTGGWGGTDGVGQDGGTGGDGADCPCQSGGAGNGASGGDSGPGGRGGRGGVGGPGGNGGDGRDIFVRIPSDFAVTRMAFHAEAGRGGDGGVGGPGGIAGTSGAAGQKGHALGNSLCPATTSHDGNDGVYKYPLGPGDVGPTGAPGNPGERQGQEHITRRPPPPPPPGSCDKAGQPSLGVAKLSTGGAEDLIVKETEQKPSFDGDRNCCSNLEASECSLNGGVWDDVSCTCISPIIIDVLGNGFDLTDAANGVAFDILNERRLRQVSWTSPLSDDAFLVLDRNENGLIDNGRELFGSSTPQPPLGPGEFKNGFRALAVFDRYYNGGNEDGRISRLDQVYSRLKLWQDTNHNGVSEAGEIFSLEDLGLRSIDLDYTEHRRQDTHGNWFRFRSKVRDANEAQMGRWAWDVHLEVQ